MNLKNKSHKPDFLKQENRPVQYFTEEYINWCKNLSLEEIVDKISELQNQFWLKHSNKNRQELQKIKVGWLLK